MALAFGSRRVWGHGICSIPSLLSSTRSMSSNKIFIGGLQPWIKEPVLREAFSGFGQVTDVAVIRNMDTGESKGFGFVSFTKADSAEAAIDGLDGQFVSNRSLRVRPATPLSRP